MNSVVSHCNTHTKKFHWNTTFTKNERKIIILPMVKRMEDGSSFLDVYRIRANPRIKVTMDVSNGIVVVAIYTVEQEVFFSRCIPQTYMPPKKFDSNLDRQFEILKKKQGILENQSDIILKQKDILKKKKNISEISGGGTMILIAVVVIMLALIASSILGAMMTNSPSVNDES